MAQTTSLAIEMSETTPRRWRSMPLPVRMMFVVAGALFAMALTMMGVQAQAPVSNTVCQPVALPLSGAETRAVNSEPTLDYEGERAGFWSTANPVGSNADRSIEIFVADTTALTDTEDSPIDQVTLSRGNILGGFNVMPDIVSFFQGDDRHSYVVFASDRDYEPARSTISNTDGGFEIFLAQTEPTARVWQLTSTSRSASILPTVSSLVDGRYLIVAYLSDADGAERRPRATENPDRNYEVHTMRLDLAPVFASASGRPSIDQEWQLTRTSLDTVNDQPVISAKGSHVAFLSNANAGIGGVSNNDRNREVFVSTIGASPTTIQVTRSATGDNDAPDISEDGSRVVFASTVLTYTAAGQGTGTGAQSIWLARLDPDKVAGVAKVSRDVVAPTGQNAHPVTAKEPAISDDGRRVVFASNGCDRSVSPAACNQPAGLFQIFVADQQLSNPNNFSMARVTNSITRTHELPAVSGNAQQIALVTTQESSVENPDLSGSEIVSLECRQARLGPVKTMTTESPSLQENRPDVGDIVAFRLTLENTTFADFTGTMFMTDTLPGGLTWLDQSVVNVPIGSSITNLNFDPESRRLTWRVVNLPKLTEAVVELRARVNSNMAGVNVVNRLFAGTPQEGDLENQGITNFDGDDVLEFRVSQVDLSSRLGVSKQVVREGELFDYVLTVSNPFSVPISGLRSSVFMDPATSIVVSTTVRTSTDLAFVSSTDPNFNPATGIWTIPRINPAQTVTLRVTMAGRTGRGGHPAIEARVLDVRSDQGDINSSNNAPLPATPPPANTLQPTVRIIGTDLQTVRLRANQNTPPLNSLVSFALDMRNNGPLPNVPPAVNDPYTGANVASFVPFMVRATAVIPPGIVFDPALFPGTGASDGAIIAGGGADPTQIVWEIPGWTTAQITRTLSFTGLVTAAPGSVITATAGSLVAMFSDSTTMNDPVANHGPQARSVRVNSPAIISEIVPDSLDEGGRVVLDIEYSDEDPGDRHTIKVDWGDGSPPSISPELIRPTGVLTGTWVITHTYADDPPGVSSAAQFEIGITITDTSQTVQFGASPVTVRNVEPTATSTGFQGGLFTVPAQPEWGEPETLVVLHGTSVTATVAFTDPGFSTLWSQELFTSTVDWGDGVIVPGAVTNVTQGVYGVPTQGSFSVDHLFPINPDPNWTDIRTARVALADDDMATPKEMLQRTLRIEAIPDAVDDVYPGDAILGPGTVICEEEFGGGIYGGLICEGDVEIPLGVWTNDWDNEKSLLQIVGVDSEEAAGTIWFSNQAIYYTAGGEGFPALKAGELFTDTFSYTVRDRIGFEDTATVTVTVTGLNEPPRIDLDGFDSIAPSETFTTFVENGPPVLLAPLGEVMDPDGDDDIVSIRAELDTTQIAPGEYLTATASGGVIATWYPLTTTLILEHSGAGAYNWENVLRSVRYDNLSDRPDEGSRMIAFSAVDSQGAVSPEAANAFVEVVAVDDAPVITTSTTPITATEGGAAVAVDDAISVFEPDTDLWIDGLLTVTVQDGNMSDVLNVMSQGNITVVDIDTSFRIDYAFPSPCTVGYVNGQGSSSLQITAGTADPLCPVSDAIVEEILRAVYYARLEGVVQGDRTVVFTARSDDDGPVSEPATRTIEVEYTNAPPVVTIDPISGVMEDQTRAIRSFIGVADPDSGDNPINMNIQVSTGAITVTGFSMVSGNGSGNVTVVAPVAQLDQNGAIDYRAAPDFFGTVWITVTVNDQGFTGDGGPMVDAESVTFNVAPVNDAPVVTLSAPDVTEDETANIRSNINVVDIDSGANNITMRIQVTNGTVGVTGFSTVSGDGTNDVTITAPVADLNSAGAINFVPTPNYYGGATLTVTVNDLGFTGGGALQDTKSVGFDIEGDNDAPTITLTEPMGVQEDIPANISSSIVVDDIDAGSGNLRMTLQADHGVFRASGVTTSGVDVEPLVLTGTLAALNSAVITYTSDLNFNGTETLRVTVNDLGNTPGDAQVTGPQSITFTVTAVNDAPILDLNGGGDGIDHIVSFAEGEAPKALSQGAAITDVDSTQILSATVVLSNRLDGSDESLLVFGGLPSGISATPSSTSGTYTLSFTGSANLNNYASAMGQVRYNNASENPNQTTRIVEFRIQDAGGAVNSPSAFATVNVTALNDPPVLTVVTPTGVEEETAIDFSQFITVTDPDVGSENMTMAVTVTQGILNVSGISVTGNGTGAIVATGTVTQVNAAVLSFVGNTDYEGPATLTVRVSDNGNSPPPEQETGAGPVEFTIQGVNDAPTLSVESPTGVLEDVATNIRSSIVVTDVDADPGSLRMEVVVGSGVLTATAAGLTVSGNGTPSVVMTGTVSDLNAGPLIYLSEPNANATTTLSVFVSDLGNTGLGGAKTASQGPVALPITPVNDLPTIATNSGMEEVLTPLTATVPVTFVLPIGSLVATDVDSGTAATDIIYTIKTMPSNGVMVLNSTQMVACASAGVSTFTQDDLDNGRVKYRLDTYGAVVNTDLVFALANAAACAGDSIDYNIQVHP